MATFFYVRGCLVIVFLLFIILVVFICRLCMTSAGGQIVAKPTATYHLKLSYVQLNVMLSTTFVYVI